MPKHWHIETRGGMYILGEELGPRYSAPFNSYAEAATEAIRRNLDKLAGRRTVVACDHACDFAGVFVGHPVKP